MLRGGRSGIGVPEIGVIFGAKPGGGADPISVFAVAIAFAVAAGVPASGVRRRGTIGGGFPLGVAAGVTGGPVPMSVTAFAAGRGGGEVTGFGDTDVAGAGVL